MPRRVSYDRAVFDSGSYVAKSLADALQPSSAPSERLVISAMKCCTSWVQVNQIPFEALDQLYSLVLHHLTHSTTEGTFLATAGCLEEWILSAIELFTPTRLEPLLDLFAGPWATQRIQSARTEEMVSEEALAVIKLLVTLIEFAYRTLVDNLASPRSMALCNNLLLVTSFPGQFAIEEEISDQGFTVWGLLEEAMSDEGCIGNDPNNEKQVVGKQLYGALVEALRQKILWPVDSRKCPKGALLGFFDAFNSV
jgi:hypothetical protein